MSKGQLSAVLCGVLSVVGAEVFDRMDWHEVGIPEDLARRWWERHQAEDIARREREARAAEAKRQREVEELARLQAKYGGAPE